MTIDRAAYEFFRQHAGYIVGHNAKGALDLARAEKWASGKISFEWTPDEYHDRGPIDWGWPDRDIARWNRSEHTCEQVVAYAECKSCHSPLSVASLCGIWDADDDYRRVIEAELALESMSGYDQGDY